jgi:tetratricopeptide (TPR) repeat protein
MQASPRFRGRLFSSFAFVAVLVSTASSSPLAAQPPDGNEELLAQQRTAERFMAVLERNPRRGTALDKVYGFHVENGSLDSFVKSLQDRVAAKADDSAGWMILGLIENQRGRDAAAVAALTSASKLRPSDPLAAYYLAQSLVLVGQPDKAVAAFEDAIARKPSPADLLDIFQALGRVHQRAARTPEALAVWSRLEKLFPGDARVQEQIAVTLVEEGQYADALPRYEALAKATTDDYRRTVYRMDAAELKLKLNRRAEAIEDLEQVLLALNPESWLFRDVRRKIEEVFLRTDDQDGLASYYSKWLDSHADDVEAMARLARVLARQSRSAEASQWLTKALARAPSRRDLRLALIDELVDDHKLPAALAQYAELDKLEPNNPDVLRDWGKLVLRDSSREKSQRQAEAERIWRRLLVARPMDPLAATQVADLLRHADMQAPALALYEQAAEWSGGSPQYLEYLGEYYHVLKRSDDALATWRKMAAGQSRTATNLARLAEVLAQFGYLQQALPEIAAACELEPRDLGLHLKAAELRSRAEQYDAALASLAKAETIAQNDDERELVLNQTMKCLELQGTLGERAAALTKKAAGGQLSQREWFLLARYREALREYAEATKAIAQALALKPDDVPSLAASARIAEQAGDMGAAAEQNRKLATIDRRGRSTYLERVANLEAQLGRTDAALAAGKELLAAAPGNTETHQFYADLCLRLGRADEGLAALRRATRLNPSEPSLLLSLASALANQFRQDEAIEVYWQAYEKERDFDDKLSIIARLTELYLQNNHLDRLLERLERGRREADQRREMTIALAQAYQSAGDYGMARQELESLIGDNTRDTTLLLQLSKLAEMESDFSDAVKYQQQLVRLAPGHETEYRLAALLDRSGDHAESAVLMAQLAAKETDRGRLLRSLDGLLTGGQNDAALAILDAKLREHPADWELLYRRGTMLSKTNSALAARDFEALLNLALPDEEPSVAGRGSRNAPPAALIAAAAAGAAGSRAAGLGVVHPTPFTRLFSQSPIRSAVGLDPDGVVFSSRTRSQSVWTPATHGESRMAAIGWLYRFAADRKAAEEFLASRRQRIDSPAVTIRELWDWLYLQTLRLDSAETKAIARQLAQLGDLAGQYHFLSLVVRPPVTTAAEAALARNAQSADPPDAADLDLAIKCLASLERQSAEMGSGVQIALMSQLRRAGRTEEADRIYHELMTHGQTARQIVAAMQAAAENDDLEQTLVLLDRFAKRDLQSTESRAAVRTERTLLASAVNRIAGTKQRDADDLLQLLDHYLDYQITVAGQQLNNPLARLANATPASPSATAVRTSLGVPVYSAGLPTRRVTFNYPLPNAHHDSNTIMVLRSFYEQFKQRDLLSDFQKHLQARATAAAGEKVFWLLIVAYVQVWEESFDQAFENLAAALELAPSDVELRLQTARLYIQHQKFDDALTLVDAVAPTDQRAVQDRETLALDLAVRLGDHQRAREAAQRLFGLRLDAATQANLAGQMRRLGMHAEADAVLARTQRQAGSRPAALAALMHQYEEQGQTDQAVQVAQRLIRATRTQSVSTSATTGLLTSDSQYRTAAIQSLSKAGKLKEIIAAQEDQIRRTPTATVPYESLAEYYQLAGDTQKANEVTERLIALKPDDAQLRYRYAQDLYRQRKMPEACEQYKIVLQKQPQLIAQRYFEVTQAFQQARKDAELVEVLSQIDLKAMGQSSMVTNMLSTMLRSPQGRTAGMVLFKKAWEAFPADRIRLIGYLNDELWKQPEVLDYAKQALRPTHDLVRRDPWYGLQSGGIGFSSTGTVSSGMSRLLAGATQANRLDEVRTEIAAGVQDNSDWLAGPVILALIDLRQKKEVDIPVVLKPLMEATAGGSSLQYTRCIVAAELETRPQYRELAAQLYRDAMLSGSIGFSQYQFSPASSVVRLYKQLGKNDEALAFLRKTSRGETSGRSTISLPSSMRADNLIAIAKQFEQLEAPADALQLYRDVVNDNLGAVSTSSVVFSGGTPYKQQAQQGLQSVLTAMGKQPSALISLLTPDDKRPASAPAIDLMIGTSTTSNSLPALLRPLESPILQIAVTNKLSAQQRATVEAHLAQLIERFPQDFSVRIFATLFTPPDKRSAAIGDLVNLMRQLPLDDLAGQKPNSRQRAKATEQVPLWLAARELLGQSELREAGQLLADRALEAARRQTDHALLAAILYEWGRLAARDGDKAAAEKRWQELVEIAVVQQRKAPAATSSTTASQRGRTTTRSSGAIASTTSQFAVAATIAQAAAEQDMIDLSLWAMSAALAGGLPVLDPATNGRLPTIVGGRGGFVGGSFGSSPLGGFGSSQPGSRGPITPQQQGVQDLTSRLWQLAVIWQQHSFPADRVFPLLSSLVFPASRPGEILLPDQPQAIDLLTSRSIGGILVDWASRADRGAELKRQVAARQASATDVARGHLLLIELSLVQKEPEEAGPHLSALAAQLDKARLTLLEKRVADTDKSSVAAQPVATPQQPKADAVRPVQPPPRGAKATRPAGAAPAQKTAAAEKPSDGVDGWWSDLEKTEAVAARALLKLADRPKETVDFLKTRLRPLKITTDRVQTLLVNLGSDNEETWKPAYEELEYFDPRLAIDLATLMNDVTTSPARQRLVEVLSQRAMGSLADKDVTIRQVGGGSGYNFFDGRGSWWAEHQVERINIGGNPKRKWTQAVRAIILLEHIGTPEAVAILRDMATGHPEAQPTKLAVEALDRLASKAP